MLYYGEVALLDLRGGGTDSGERQLRPPPPPPLGAGVRGWLDDDPELARHEAAQLRPSGGPEETQRHDQHDEGSASLGAGDRANDAASFRPRLVTGRQGETEVLICLACCKDVPVRGVTWRACACGAFRCAECALVHCAKCGGTAESNHGSLSPPQFNDSWGQEQQADYSFADTAAFAWDSTHADVESPSAETGSHLRCASCAVGSSWWAGEWRICQCRLAFCAYCARSGCEACGYLCEGAGGNYDITEDEFGTAYGGGGFAYPEAPSQLADEAMAMPTILTPAAAAARREGMMAEAKVRKRAERANARAAAKVHIANGKRPKRHRRPDEWVSFATANITTAQRLKEEITRGGELAACDFLGIQEHGLHGGSLAEAEGWLAREHWAGFVGAADQKNEGHGGGIAAITRHAAGLRRACTPKGILKGRLSLGFTQVDVAITFGIFYGLSGAAALAQRPYWKLLVDEVLALGRPFVLAGDWQLSPEAVRASGLCRALDAEICAPHCATNTTSGGKLDYFIVSRSLLHRGWRVRPLHGCTFKTHIPVVLELNIHVSCQPTRRLQQPRLLPVERPDGNAAPGIVVDWARWGAAAASGGGSCEDRMRAATAAMEDWYAGAEAELISQIGLASGEHEVAFMGIGLEPREVVEHNAKRFKNVPDNFGIVGHRLEWARNAIHMVTSLAPIIIAAAGNADSGVRQRVDAHQETLSMIGHRACSFAREQQRRPYDADADAFWPLVAKGMKAAGELVRNRHGRRPRLCVWRHGEEGGDLDRFNALADELEDALRRLARERTRRHRAKVKKWADALPGHAGHKVTKCPEAALTMSASADKAHRGERTQQEAADRVRGPGTVMEG